MADEKLSPPANAPISAPVRKVKWPWIAAGSATATFVISVLFVLYMPHSQLETDDAYVTVHYAAIAPRITGQVSQVLVEDNQQVKKGQLLIVLDPTDLELKLDQANAILAQDLASVSQAEAQVDRQPCIIDQAEAALRSAKAGLTLAQANASRDTFLSQTGAGSIEKRQQSDAALGQDLATVQSAQAGLAAAHTQLVSLRASYAAALAKIRTDRTNVAQAALELSYSKITAPIDGVVDERAVQVGDFVTPGAAMLALVPLDHVWIEANYRELDLRHMRAGQPVRIHVDAYNVWLKGIVQSIAPSSGSAYSPLPSDNATGNFTKIVQRLPVKIVLDSKQPDTNLLRVGMSVETMVDTRSHPVVGEN